MQKYSVMRRLFPLLLLDSRDTFDDLDGKDVMVQLSIFIIIFDSSIYFIFNGKFTCNDPHPVDIFVVNETFANKKKRDCKIYAYIQKY